MIIYIDKIFTRVGVKNKEDLTDQQLQRAFLLAIKDFKDENLMLEELSALASFLWAAPSKDDSPEVVTLKNTMDSCSEISFYLHKIPGVDKEGKQMLSYLMDTLSYFEKYKHLLD